MKRTRLTVVATLLVALLLTGCGQIARGEENTTDGEVTQTADLYPFVDFPSGAEAAKTKTAGSGQVTQATADAELFHAKFEGSDVSGSGGVVGGKYHFIATQTDGESWHVKLESNYPTVAGRDYYVTYRFTSDVSGTVKFGDFQEFQIQQGENTVTGVFTAKDSTSYLDLQLGMLPAFTIDFTEIEVKEYADEVDFENALPKPINFERESRVYERHDQGYDTILVRRSHAINVNYETIPTDLGVWKSRLYVRTGLVPEPGVHYRITADVMSDRYERPIKFEVLFNDGEVEKGYGALYGQELTPGEVNTCEAVITGNGNGDELILQFSLGEARGGSVIVVGNVHVDKIVDHYTNVLPEGYALDTSVATGKIIEEQVPVSYTDIPLSPAFYSGVDTVYEQHDDGYVVNLTENGSSATMAITQAPSNPDDRGVWKAKLYAATGVSLKPGTSYRVQFDLDSTGNQADYEVCFDGDSENAYGALYGRSLKAGGTDHIDMLISPNADLGPLTVRMQLGKTDTAAGNTVTLRNFSVESVKINYKDVLPASFSYETGDTPWEYEYSPVPLNGFSYDTGVNVSERHGDGYSQSVSADNSGAMLSISKAPSEGRDPWNSCLLINTGVKPEEGKKYTVSFDMTADRNQPNFEVDYDSAREEKGYGAKYAQVIGAGESKEIRYSFVSTKSDEPLILRLQLGHTQDESGNTITVSNVKVVEVTMGEGKSALPEEFAYPRVTTIDPDKDEAGYYQVELPTMSAWEQHADGFKQELGDMSLNISEVPAPGVWDSKLFVDTKTALEAGSKYKVTANVTSAKAMDFEVCYNNGGEEKGYGDTALYGQSIAEGETKDLVYEFEAKPSGDPKDLVLQFMLGKSPAGNTFKVNSVKLEKWIPEHKESETVPAEYTEVAIEPIASDRNDDGMYDQVVSGMGITINAVPESGDPWNSTLYVNTNTDLEAGATYKLTASVTSTKAIPQFEVDFSNGDNEKAYGAVYNQSIDEEETKTYTQEFTAGEGRVILQFQLGKSPAGTTFTVDSVKLEKLVPEHTKTETIGGAYANVELSALNSWEQHADGFKQELGDMSLNISEVPAPGVWDSKLFVDTKTALEAGSKYKVTANVTSAKAMDFEVCYNNGGEEKGYGDTALYGQSIAEGETKDLVYEFEAKPSGDPKDLVLQFMLGKSPAGNTFKVNSVKLEKWKDAGEDLGPTEQLEPGSFSSVAGDGYTVMMGGDGNSATLKFDAVSDKQEVYEAKLFADTGVKLADGKTYKISVDVKADEEFPYEICYNDGKNEKGIGAKYELTAKTEPETVTFEATPDAEKSLIIQFSLGKAAAGNTVTVSNIKVEEFEETEGDNLMKDALKAWAPIHQWAGEEYVTSLSNTDASATMAIDTVSTEQDDWKVKMFVETGAELTAGKRYSIRYDIQADNAFDFNVFYNNGAEEKAVGDFYNLSAGSSKQTVEHIVTPENDAVLNIQLMLGKSMAPNKVTISNVHVDEVIGPDVPDVYPINCFVLENSGYEASLSNTKSSATIDITKVPASGREPWKVKLFAETGAQLEAGKTYRVSVDVKATNPMSYDLCFNNREQEAQLGALYGQEMSTSKKTLTYNVTPSQDSVLFLQLNLGNATGANKVTISGIKVEELNYTSAKSIIPNFSYDSVGYLSKGSDEGYVTSLKKNQSSADFRITRAPSERHAWNAKVIVKTGITPAAGKGYRVTFDLNAAKSQNLFELFCDGNEELAYGALYEQHLNAGNNTISYTIMPGDSKGPLTLQLRFGETDGMDGNAYTISNFKLEEVEFVTAYNPEIKDACVNDVQDGYTATLKRTRDRASVQLVSTPEEGREAWKNKLFVYTGVVFEPEQKYRVTFNVSSIIPTPFEICFNKSDEEKGLGGIFGLTALPQGTYIEYTTYAKEDAPLVVQLSLGNCTAPNTIFLNDFKVEKAGKINLASDTIYHF